eukprot:760124-Hanusia_phi.AAC.5
MNTVLAELSQRQRVKLSSFKFWKANRSGGRCRPRPGTVPESRMTETAFQSGSRLTAIVA